MNEIGLLLLMAMLWFGYIKQIWKVYIAKNANGVSYQAFLLGALAGLSILLQTENPYLKAAYFGSTILALALTVLVISL